MTNKILAIVFATVVSFVSAKSNAEQPPHALTPVIAKTKAAIEHIDATIETYSTTFVKRERVAGTLLEHEFILTKVRHKPFSVHMVFLSPQSIKGREVAYVDGRNEGKLSVKSGSRLGFRLPDVIIDPRGTLAMRGNRYPITEFGIRTLCVRLVEGMENDVKLGDCEVQWYENAKVADRKATCVQIKHPLRKPKLTFYIARIYFDDERNIPIRFESYDWPKETGGKPQLLEEYTYTDLELNVELTDESFK